MAEDPVPQIKTKVNPRQEKNRSSKEHEEFSGTKGIIQIRGAIQNLFPMDLTAIALL